MYKISVILVVRNEEKKLRRCLDALKGMDEIVVVDQSSTDNTVAICREYTDRVFVVESKQYCEPDRVLAASKTRNDWILYLDADEVLTSALRAEIEAILSGTPAFNSYYVARKNIFLGKWIRGSGWYPAHVLRLFKKNFVNFPAKIHADITPVGEAGYLKEPLIHYTCEDLKDYFQKTKRYSSILAEQAYEKGRRVTLVNFIYRLGILPVLYFFYKWIFKGGIRDGFQGVLIACLTFYTIFSMNIKLLRMGHGPR